MPASHVRGPEDKDLIDSISQHVQGHLADWYGSSASLLTKRPEIRHYTNSFILRYELATFTDTKAILVKIRRNPKMTSLRRAVESQELHTNTPGEYSTLRHVYEGIGTRHQYFAAVRPLEYLEDYYAIAMEEFPSRSLRHLLQKHRNKADGQLELIAQRAGQLLRFFHEHVYSTTQCVYSVDDILADAEMYALQLEQHSSGRIQMQKILDAVAQKLSNQEIRAIPYTSAHQDLSCDNVLYSEDGKVGLIDIKVKPAPIYSDLGLLLIHPETFRNQIFSDGRYFSPKYLQGYRDSILEGYFAGAATNHDLVNIYAAIRVLDKWGMHQALLRRYRGLKRVLTRPLSPLVTAYFQRVWRSYLELTV